MRVSTPPGVTPEHAPIVRGVPYDFVSVEDQELVHSREPPSHYGAPMRGGITSSPCDVTGLLVVADQRRTVRPTCADDHDSAQNQG